MQSKLLNYFILGSGPGITTTKNATEANLKLI